MPGDLGPRRGGVVVDAAPGADHAADPLFDVDIGAEGRRVNGEGRLQVVESHADLLGGLEGQGPDVDVLAVAVAAEDLDGGVDHLLVSEGQLDLQDLGRVPQAFEMRLHEEREELLLVWVPVGPDALEAAGAVVQGVGHEAQMDVLVLLVLAVEEHPALGLPGSRVPGRVGFGLDCHSP